MARHATPGRARARPASTLDPGHVTTETFEEHGVSLVDPGRSGSTAARPRSREIARSPRWSALCRQRGAAMNLRAALLTSLLPATLLLGCAAAEPPRHPVSEAAPVQERVDTGPTSVESEIGGMSEEDVTLAFASMRQGVLDCAE